MVTDFSHPFQPLHNPRVENHHRPFEFGIQQNGNQCHELACIKFSTAAQGVESQKYIATTKTAIDSAVAAGRPFGPDIPWRPVDYFQHLDLSSDDMLKCSVFEDTSADRKCMQGILSAWNARLHSSDSMFSIYNMHVYHLDALRCTDLLAWC